MIFREHIIPFFWYQHFDASNIFYLRDVFLDDIVLSFFLLSHTESPNQYFTFVSISQYLSGSWFFTDFWVKREFQNFLMLTTKNDKTTFFVQNFVVLWCSLQEQNLKTFTHTHTPFTTSSASSSKPDTRNAILFQINVFTTKIKENMPARYFIKVNACPSFKWWKIIRQTNKDH